MKKIRIWLIVICLLALGYWVYRVVTKPLPGETPADLGRDHVTDIFGVKYSSNPPASGPHFAIWAKSGVYDRLFSDGYLIHSLEHGYVIVSYDCSKPISVKGSPFTVLAHDEPVKESTNSGEFLMHMDFSPKEGESWFTPDNPPEIEVELPESFESQSCNDLIDKLSEFTKVAQRVIVVPRVGMDTPVALTAWGRILKLDTVDKKAITNFIKTYHNKGPEATME